MHLQLAMSGLKERLAADRSLSGQECLCSDHSDASHTRQADAGLEVTTNLSHSEMLVVTLAAALLCFVGLCLICRVNEAKEEVHVTVETGNGSLERAESFCLGDANGVALLDCDVGCLMIVNVDCTGCIALPVARAGWQGLVWLAFCHDPREV